MKKLFLVWMMSGIVSTLCCQKQAQASDFVLSESYPANGQTVTVSDLFNNTIYLKFNTPVDRNTVGYISDDNHNCQLNICGWLEFAENDTKLIWHPNDGYELYHFKPGAFFKIRIGVSDLGIRYGLKDINGKELPITYIGFKIDECTPSINIKVSGNSLRPSDSCGEFGYSSSFVLGDTIYYCSGSSGKSDL